MEAAPLTLRPMRARIGERFGLPYFDGVLLGAALALIASEDPSVVLLDLNMPRLDGHAVARRLKKHWPHVRVIVLTGSDAAEDRRRAERAGVDAFVEKSQLVETQLSALIASV